ncbi:MAG: transcription elongation factor GreA [Deltaproteobacteria bacterium]|nr:transcription elongation factor GreA [Deltaproteobacteria bacterium]
MTRGQPVPMTPEGHKKLHEELKHLKSVERPRVVLDIEEARAHGDLKENAEYHAAKEKQAHLSRRIGEVEDALSRAQVIDPSKLDHKKVVFGAAVRLLDTESGEEITYRIVGAHETNIKEGKISIESPIAKSLIGKRKEDLVKVTTPRGSREFEIMEIRYG